MSTDLIDGLKDCIDDVLSVRDDIGAVLYPVYIVTRTWSGTEVGDGSSSDATAQILPTPYIVDYSHDVRLREGGNVRQGDIILKNISKSAYPLESNIDCSSSNPLIEKFYSINGKLYNVIHVKDDYLVWHVHLRRLARN